MITKTHLALVLALAYGAGSASVEAATDNQAAVLCPTGSTAVPVVRRLPDPVVAAAASERPAPALALAPAAGVVGTPPRKAASQPNASSKSLARPVAKVRSAGVGQRLNVASRARRSAPALARGCTAAACGGQSQVRPVLTFATLRASNALGSGVAVAHLDGDGGWQYTDESAPVMCVANPSSSTQPAAEAAASGSPADFRHWPPGDFFRLQFPENLVDVPNSVGKHSDSIASVPALDRSEVPELLADSALPASSLRPRGGQTPDSGLTPDHAWPITVVPEIKAADPGPVVPSAEGGGSGGSPVPEPATLALLALGFAAMQFSKYRSKAR